LGIKTAIELGKRMSARLILRLIFPYKTEGQRDNRVEEQRMNSDVHMGVA